MVKVLSGIIDVEICFVDPGTELHFRLFKNIRLLSELEAALRLNKTDS